MSIRAKGNSSSQKSQKRIDKLSEETDVMLTEYRSTLSQVDALRVYNRQVEELIAAQEEEIASLQGQIDGVELVGRQITPLMLKMIDGLNAFVDLDVPFLLDERTNRVEGLRELMVRADITDAEKYRKIMEAYQIENEFGRTIEAYAGPIEEGGTTREVNFLRVGRIALVYQTKDGIEVGAWDQSAGNWVQLGNEFRTPIRLGIRIARKQAAPDLITLPMPAAEDVQ